MLFSAVTRARGVLCILQLVMARPVKAFLVRSSSSLRFCTCLLRRSFLFTVSEEVSDGRSHSDARGMNTTVMHISGL